MMPINQATERLQNAIERLDHVVTTRIEESANAAGSADVAVMRGDLENAKQKSAALEDVTDKVATRLDGIIARLTSVLEA